MLSAVLMLSLAPILVALVIAAWLLSSTEFSVAGVLALLLLPGTYALGLGTIGAYHLFGRGATGRCSTASAAGTAVTILANLMLVPLAGLQGAALATSIAYLTFGSLILRYVSRDERVRVSDLVRPDFDTLARAAKSMLQRIA
jgi:O-antigen/teichoic acid export membrane protein